MTDRRIAEECKDVDIVVGGHSHTFLYSGTQPNSEVPAGPYPTVVTRADGTKVPVVQAYAYTKYLGYMKLSVSFIIFKMSSSDNLFNIKIKPFKV